MSISKIAEEFIKRVKECKLRNGFCLGLSNEDALALKKAFEELLVNLIMEMEDDSLSENMKTVCESIKNATKELTLILGSESSHREITLEKNLQLFVVLLKDLRAEIQKNPLPSSTSKISNTAEEIKNNLKLLHEAYSRKDFEGSNVKDVLSQVEQRVVEMKSNEKLDAEMKEKLNNDLSTLQSYFTNSSDFSKKKELQEDMREFLKNIKLSQQMLSPKNGSLAVGRSLTSGGGRKKSANPMEKTLKGRSLTRTLTGSNDFFSHLLLNEADEIGKGVNGTIFKAIWKLDNSVVAVKRLKIEKKIMEILKKELSIMEMLEHKNVVFYRMSFIHDNYLWIVMEYCDLGSLRHILDQKKKGFEEAFIVVFISQVVQALDYLHNVKNIIHRDIKCGNILVTSSGPLDQKIKIADYGTSTEENPHLSHNTVVGSLCWVAPEVITQNGHNSKVDMWSLGICILEMAEFNPPFYDYEMSQISQALANVNVPPPSFKNKKIWSKELQDLVSKILVRDVQQRNTARDLLQHPIVVNCDYSVMDPFCLDPVGSTTVTNSAQNDFEKDADKEELKKDSSRKKEDKKKDSLEIELADSGKKEGSRDKRKGDRKKKSEHENKNI